MKRLIAMSFPIVLTLVVVVSIACERPALVPPAPELTMPAATEAPPSESSPTPIVAPTPAPTREATRAATPEPTATRVPTATPEPSATRVPTPTPGPTPVATQIDWNPCESGSELECGFVSVPADYRNPEAGSLSIAVNVHRSTSPDQRIGYLFVSPGGPGSSGLEMVQGAPDGAFTDEIVERFDIIGFDPRGVGASEPTFACGEPGEQAALLAAIEGEIDTVEETAAAEAAANLCIDSMGSAGGLLHTEYVARDMDEIRRVLGVEQISYYGSGYGATLGAWYATLFPESVRAMVADSADNPVVAAATQEERALELISELAELSFGLEAALTACADAECPIYNDGDPVAYYYQAAEKLHLVNVAANNPNGGVLGVITTLYDELVWPTLWRGLHELNEFDDPTILSKAASLQLGSDPSAASVTAHVNCLDNWALYPELDRATRLEDEVIAALIIAEAFPLFAAMDVSFTNPCPFYDQFAPDPAVTSLDGGGAPILVIGNPADPITSFDQSAGFATSTLSNGYLVETSHHKHVVYPENQCVNRHVHRALIDGVYPAARQVTCYQEDPDPEPLVASGEIVLTPCADIFECGTVGVPADYQDPEAGTIEIFVIVHRATIPDQRIGYLFVNPGGPGGSGATLAISAAFGAFADELLERFDIVGFDPRGVGLSDPAFACGEPGERTALLASVDGIVDTAEEIATGEAAANLCIESMGQVAGRLHSAYVANDMDELREALGADQISYLGFSYGSALGGWYATLFPDSVRAMVVDGAANPVAGVGQDDDEGGNQDADLEAKIGEILDACADPECPIFNNGDPVEYYYRATAKMDLVIAAADNNPDAAVFSVIGALYDEASWPTLWQGLFELKEYDDPSILLSLAKRNLEEEPGAVSFTEHVNCLDNWVLHPEFDRASRLAQAAAGADTNTDAENFPLLSATLEHQPTIIPCDFYDQFAPNPLEGPLDGGGLPILVIGNHRDPVTSFRASQEYATDVLSNGYLLETSHSAHAVYPRNPRNQCVADVVHQALIDGVLPAERHVVCEQEE